MHMRAPFYCARLDAEPLQKLEFATLVRWDGLVLRPSPSMKYRTAWDPCAARPRLPTFHIVRRSSGADRFTVKPSRFQSREILPANWPVTVSRASKLPNPSFSCCPLSGGPPCSRHASRSSSFHTDQLTLTWPLSVDNAPYFAALVAISWQKGYARDGPL
jgi:hypothetical protein